MFLAATFFLKDERSKLCRLEDFHSIFIELGFWGFGVLGFWGDQTFAKNRNRSPRGENGHVATARSDMKIV